MALLIGGTLALIYLPRVWAIVVIVALAAFELVEVWFWMWLGRGRPRAGQETLVGEHGTLGEDGRVRIRGTTYRADVLEGEPGDPVRVEGIDGLTLVVRRHDPYEDAEAG